MSSDPFYDAESSADASHPVELYTIVNGLTTWYHTSGERDVVYNGQLYTATACDRTEIGVNVAQALFELTLTLPCSHDLAIRWPACSGTPPRKVTVTVQRLQIDIGLVEQFWQGEIGAMTIKKGLAYFNIPSRFGRRVKMRVGTASFNDMCPHTLYDSKCTIADSGFTVTTTASGIIANSLLVDMLDVAKTNGTWAVFGDLLHVPSGERMLVTAQRDISSGVDTRTRLTLQGQIFELKSGDQVKIRAGCDHSVATCVTKYSNQLNFGGFPGRPLKNPMIPTGLGVTIQS